MITCYLKYTIDPYKIKEFEQYGTMWVQLVEKFGGNHHGYYLPHESVNNIAISLFSFKSLSDYEKYRIKSIDNLECKKAYEFAFKTKCIISYERSFLKPMIN